MADAEAYLVHLATKERWAGRWIREKELRSWARVRAELSKICAKKAIWVYPNPRAERTKLMHYWLPDSVRVEVKAGQPLPSRAGAPWRDVDGLDLHWCIIDQGQSIAKAAAFLARTEDEVRAMMSEVGLEPKSPT
jgi:hypothetical protein